MSQLAVRRAADRFVTRLPGVETRHAFSFGPHYDPAWVGHGPLVVCDEHRLEPRAGFDPHPHRDLEVVSWVLEGVLRHEHDGRTGELGAGGLQRMSAGSGVVHAEHAGDVPTRFLQLWLVPDQLGQPPSYEQTAVRPAFGPVLSGTRAPVHAGRLEAGRTQRLPAGFLVVARGAVVVDGVALDEGDAARLPEGGLVDTALGADLLLCELPRS